MNKSKSSLTVFFMLLTISIGLVSVNSPLNAKAQNNVLSQNGVGEAEQETEQGQSSAQDNQIVSGDSSILSGNNLGCQSMDNVQDITNEESFCILHEANPPNSQPPGISQSVLLIHTYLSGQPFPPRATITVSDSSGSETFEPRDIVYTGDIRGFFISPNERFTVTVNTDRFDPVEVSFSGRDVCDSIRSNSCSGIKANSQQELIISIRERPR
jgi:hypothetical protein